MSSRPSPPHDGDGSWRTRAACRDRDARQFTDPRPGTEDVRKALATCATCSVREACLAAALRHSAEADVGIWGGTTEQTRHQIRTGHLTVEQALNPHNHPGPQPRTDTANGTVRPQRAGSNTTHREPAGQLPAPETTVALDQHGDYVSADGRVLIFRIHGNRPWALAIDDRFITTSRTVTDARRLAWATLHDRQAVMADAQARQAVAPVQPPRRR